MQNLNLTFKKFELPEYLQNLGGKLVMYKEQEQEMSLKETKRRLGCEYCADIRNVKSDRKKIICKHSGGNPTVECCPVAHILLEYSSYEEYLKENYPDDFL